MNRTQLSQLAVLSAVAAHGSFRGAAKELGIAPSAVSHAVGSLEASLGVRLLARTTRSVAATEEGKRLLERLRPALDDIAEALQRAAEARDRPAGKLRVTAPRFAADLILAPRLATSSGAIRTSSRIAMRTASPILSRRGMTPASGSREPGRHGRGEGRAGAEKRGRRRTDLFRALPRPAAPRRSGGPSLHRPASPTAPSIAGSSRKQGEELTRFGERPAHSGRGPPDHRGAIGGCGLASFEHARQRICR